MAAARMVERRPATRVAVVAWALAMLSSAAVLAAAPVQAEPAQSVVLTSTAPVFETECIEGREDSPLNAGDSCYATVVGQSVSAGGDVGLLGTTDQRVAGSVSATYRFEVPTRRIHGAFVVAKVNVADVLRERSSRLVRDPAFTAVEASSRITHSSCDEATCISSPYYAGPTSLLFDESCGLFWDSFDECGDGHAFNYLYLNSETPLNPGVLTIEVTVRFRAGVDCDPYEEGGCPWGPIAPGDQASVSGRTVDATVQVWCRHVARTFEASPAEC